MSAVGNVFIFGNGIGRAINNDFFQLESALEYAWREDGVLTDHQRRLILSCLPPGDFLDDLRAPREEEELEDLQRVLSACDTISAFQTRVEQAEEAWLTQHGLEFPQAIRRYIHDAACYFHRRNSLIFDCSDLPDEFQRSLVDFIRASRAHIATLNYDDLLYDCFTDTPVFQHYMLRDGFFNGEFDFDRANQLAAENPSSGWFLHLHGSPLFITRKGHPRKILRAHLYEYRGHNSTHLVLTSIRHKQSVIAASPVLGSYWMKLKEIMSSARNIVIVGYGGLDRHLNREIGLANGDARVRVVEYNSGQPQIARSEFWREKLRRRDVEVVQLDNILTFGDWG